MAEALQRKSMIHVKRQLIRDCLEVLSDSPKCQIRPLRSIIELIYSLNSLATRLPNRVYERGLPRPKETKREIERLLGLIKRSMQTGNRAPLIRRIEQLYDRQADSIFVLQGMIQLHDRKLRSIFAKLDPLTKRQRLLKLAARSPMRIARAAEIALTGNWPETPSGRGGRRHGPDLQDLAVLTATARIFEDRTGQLLTMGSKDVPIAVTRKLHQLGIVLFAYFRPGHSKRAIKDMLRRRFPERARGRPNPNPTYRKQTRTPKHSRV